MEILANKIMGKCKAVDEFVLVLWTIVNQLNKSQSNEIILKRIFDFLLDEVWIVFGKSSSFKYKHLFISMNEFIFL